MAEPDGKLDRRILMIAMVVVLGAIMSILDTTVVNVALNTLARDFDTDLPTIQWIVTGYTLALATVIPVSGWAADRFGTKRIYMLSIGLFVAGSALSGAAWSAESLIAFRVLQGLGGGMLMPAGMTILTRAAGGAPGRPDHERRWRADAARPDARPDPRRLAAGRRVVALDLLREPADRHGGARHGRPRAAA